MEELAARRDETLLGKQRRATKKMAGSRDYAAVAHMEHEPDDGLVAEGGSTAAHRDGNAW